MGMEKLTDGFGLIEGPVWDPARGLIFSDVVFGGAHCLNASGETALLIAHRRGMGGMALHEDGSMVVSGRNIALKRPGEDGSRVLLDSDGESILGFNDLTTDAAGRVYAGALAFRPVGSDEEPKPAELYCIDLDGSARAVGFDVMLSNGLGFSPDGRLLYHSESRRHTVRIYDVSENGDLGPHRAFAGIENGIPDGLAVAADGSIWIAIAHGGRVDVFEPDGALRRSIPVERPMVTSLCFGGDDLKTLYIVTGSGGMESDNAGAVYGMAVDVGGLPLALARVRSN